MPKCRKRPVERFEDRHRAELTDADAEPDTQPVAGAVDSAVEAVTGDDDEEKKAEDKP